MQQFLQDGFGGVAGSEVTLAPLKKTSEDLTSDMAGNTHTVVFCTKAYATLAENLNAVAEKEKSTSRYL